MPIDPDVQPLLDLKADKTALSSKANSSTVTALATRVTALEGKLTALTTRVTTLETQTPPPPPPVTYGASNYGIAAEPATTTGTQVSSLAAVGSASGSILLRGGIYTGNVTIPSGATLKPYNGEIVKIMGEVGFSNGSTLAGIHVEQASSGWVMHLTHKTDVTIRHCKIRGGTIEAVRIDGNSRNVKVEGCDLDGGQNNHVVKVYGEYGTPTDIFFINDHFSKLFFPTPSEDLLQLGDAAGTFRGVTVDHCTFGNNPLGEDQLDIKTGQELTVTANLFDGQTNEAIMVAGNWTSPVIIDGNRVVGHTCSLGAGVVEQSPLWDFRNNRLEGTILQIRKSNGAKVSGNTHIGGHVVLGTPGAGDKPTNVVFSNQHYQGTTFYANPGSTWTPANYGAA